MRIRALIDEFGHNNKKTEHEMRDAPGDASRWLGHFFRHALIRVCPFLAPRLPLSELVSRDDRAVSVFVSVCRSPSLDATVRSRPLSRNG